MLTLVIATTVIKGFSQPVTGTWKRISTTLEYQSGKKEDLQKTLQANLPCVVNTKYIFKADGTHYTQSTKGCETIDEMSAATWKQTGNTLVLVTKQEAKLKTAGTTYTVSFSGNNMTMTHVYTAAENKITGTKVKQITVVYQRI